MSSLSETKINEAIGARIRELRKQAGLKQSDLAQAISRSHVAISHMERGVTTISAAQVFLIAQRLGCHPASIYMVDLPGFAAGRPALLLDTVAERLR